MPLAALSRFVKLWSMDKARPSDAKDLRRGWTTGACATAATKAALQRLWSGAFPKDVTITLPRGETPTFPLAHHAAGDGWAEDDRRAQRRRR